MTNFIWKVKKTNKNNKARTGKISTPHGDIETPAFIFCATKAAIKSFTTLFSIIVPLGFIFIALFHHLNAL